MAYLLNESVLVSRQDPSSRVGSGQARLFRPGYEAIYILLRDESQCGLYMYVVTKLAPPLQEVGLARQRG